MHIWHVVILQLVTVSVTRHAYIHQGTALHLVKISDKVFAAQYLDVIGLGTVIMEPVRMNHHIALDLMVNLIYVARRISALMIPLITLANRQ